MGSTEPTITPATLYIDTKTPDGKKSVHLLEVTLKPAGEDSQGKFVITLDPSGMESANYRLSEAKAYAKHYIDMLLGVDGNIARLKLPEWATIQHNPIRNDVAYYYDDKWHVVIGEKDWHDISPHNMLNEITESLKQAHESISQIIPSPAVHTPSGAIVPGSGFHRWGIG